jgi:glycosyltransferase involved in cell wall biosynthesis
MADQAPMPPRELAPLSLPVVGIRRSRLAWKLRSALSALRRGDFASLANGLGAFLRSRLAPLARRLLPKHRTRVQKALLQLAAARPARAVPELTELRARVFRFLPASPSRVSAVVPCFNYGRLVVNAVDSLRRQSYPAMEIVVVDDGSTDPATLAALRELEAAGDVRVVRQANQGLPAARNAGAAAATGELLLFLDNDDRLTPEAVALLAAHLHARPDCAYAYPAQRFFGDEELVWEPQQYDAWDVLWSNHPTVCALIRRAAFVACSGYDSIAMKAGWEDWELWIAMSGRGLHGLGVPVPVFEYRRHGRTLAHAFQQRAPLLRSRLLEKHAAAYAPAALAERKLRWRPSVSVVVPFCNAHRWWPETLASLEAQTLSDFEVVLVNDASDAPESLRMLADMRARPPVRVVDRAVRGGPAAARNTGVLAARSELVFLLDADDLLAPAALERLAWLLLASPEVGFVYPGVVHFGAQTGVCLDAYDRERLKHENFLTCAAMLRREVYVQVGGMAEEPADMHEDWDFWLRLAASLLDGRLLPEPLFFYRRHGEGRSAGVRQRVPDSAMRAVMRARNPVLFGDAAAHPPHYAPLARDASPLDDLTEDLRARYHLDLRVRYDGFRRPGVPQPFPVAAWSDSRVHVMLVVPWRRRGEGEACLATLRTLARERFHVTIVVARDGAAAWTEQAEPLVAEVIQLAHVAPHPRAALAFLEYLLMSRNVDVVGDLGTAPGAAIATLVARRYTNVRVVAPQVFADADAAAALVTLAAACNRSTRLREYEERLLEASLL